MHQFKAPSLQIANELQDKIGVITSIRNSSSLLVASHQYQTLKLPRLDSKTLLPHHLNSSMQLNSPNSSVINPIPSGKSHQATPNAIKLAQKNKVLLATNDMKDDTIRELRTELMNKGHKIEVLKSKVQKLEEDLLEIVTAFKQGKKGGGSAMDQKIFRYYEQLKQKKERKDKNRNGGKHSSIMKLDLNKIKGDILVSSK